jgi:hypothetical protein
MLRWTLIAIVALLLAGAVFAAGKGGPGLIGPAVFLGLLLLALLFETYRYRRLGAQAPGGNFVPTGERFIDPESGKLVEVHSDPSTGARRYVTVGDAKDTP